jgi:peptidoglycan-associated lipoprotein
MTLSKQLLLITSILFIFFVSGCSKGLQQPEYDELDFPEPDAGLATEKKEKINEFMIEENVGDVDTSSSSEVSRKEGNDLLSERDPDYPEPFLQGKGGNRVSSLTPEEEARRRLDYLSSDQLSDMFFAFDTYDLDEQLLAVLQKNVEYIKSHPYSRIVIQGHCDERGSNNYNLSLGHQRAHSVKSYLITLGVDESRIHTVSFGEEKPFCFEKNENCWYQNRRVRFLVAE